MCIITSTLPNQYNLFFHFYAIKRYRLSWAAIKIARVRARDKKIMIKHLDSFVYLPFLFRETYLLCNNYLNHFRCYSLFQPTYLAVDFLSKMLNIPLRHNPSKFFLVWLELQQCFMVKRKQNTKISYTLHIELEEVKWLFERKNRNICWSLNRINSI